MKLKNLKKRIIKSEGRIYRLETSIQAIWELVTQRNRKSEEEDCGPCRTDQLEEDQALLFERMDKVEEVLTAFQAQQVEVNSEFDDRILNLKERAGELEDKVSSELKKPSTLLQAMPGSDFLNDRVMRVENNIIALMDHFGLEFRQWFVKEKEEKQHGDDDEAPQCQGS